MFSGGGRVTGRDGGGLQQHFSQRCTGTLFEEEWCVREYKDSSLHSGRVSTQRVVPIGSWGEAGRAVWGSGCSAFVAVVSFFCGGRYYLAPGYHQVTHQERTGTYPS